jgi:hypothetical protein
MAAIEMFDKKAKAKNTIPIALKLKNSSGIL